MVLQPIQTDRTEDSTSTWAFQQAHLLSALSVRRHDDGGGWCGPLHAASCTGPAGQPRRLSSAANVAVPGLPPTVAAWPMARSTAWRGAPQ